MKKWLRILCAVCAVSVLLCMGVLPGSAAAGTTITIDNTGGDDNPFIRLFPNTQICGSGGPFTFSFDLKIENYRRMSGQNGSVFVHLMHGTDTNSQNTSIAYWQKNTDGWTHFEYSFSDVTYTLINGAPEKYALINIGLYYVKAKVSIKNFQITNAAGTVVYSFDTDPDLNGLDDLRNIAEKNPEPFLMACSFGESGNASYPISADGGSDTTTTTKKPQYEDDTTTTTSKSPNYEDDTTTTSAPDADGSTTSSNADGSTTSGSVTTTSKGATTTTKSGATTQPASNGAEDNGGFPVWAIVLIVVVVLAAGGAVAFVLIRRKKAAK